MFPGYFKSWVVFYVFLKGDLAVKAGGKYNHDKKKTHEDFHLPVDSQVTEPCSEKVLVSTVLQ